jgi:hypothetical protein
LGFILFGCYLFVSVLCESVFVHGFPIYQCKISLVLSLWLVNDMDREEGLGKNSFYKDASSRKALKFPVENVSKEISKGTISSHPVSRQKNLCYSLYLFVAWCLHGKKAKLLGSTCLFRGILFRLRAFF